MYIHKKFVIDENQQPVAVLIDYKDWLKIEKILEFKIKSKSKNRFARYAGVIKLKEEPLNYQKRIRKEWT